MTPDVSFHFALNSFVLSVEQHETNPIVISSGSHSWVNCCLYRQIPHTFLTCHLSLLFHTNMFHRPPPFLFKSWDVIVSVDMSFVNPAFSSRGKSLRHYVITSLPHASGFGNIFSYHVLQLPISLFLDRRKHCVYVLN